MNSTTNESGNLEIDEVDEDRPICTAGNDDTVCSIRNCGSTPCMTGLEEFLIPRKGSALEAKYIKAVQDYQG